MLQSNRDEDIGPMLDTLLSNEMTPMLMMQTVRYFVLEYDLALPSLVNWYQTFDVTSPWQLQEPLFLHQNLRKEMLQETIKKPANLKSFPMKRR